MELDMADLWAPVTTLHWQQPLQVRKTVNGTMDFMGFSVDQHRKFQLLIQNSYKNNCWNKKSAQNTDGTEGHVNNKLTEVRKMPSFQCNLQAPNKVIP